jgi:steroid delta-isomerase-like uncharacterized protein
MQVDEYTIPQMVDDVRAGRMPRTQLVQTLTMMGISPAGAQLIATATSRAVSIKPTPRVNVRDDEALQLRLHNRHLEDRNERNIGALQSDYAEDAVVEDSMYPEPFVGRAAIEARMGTGMAALPDLRVEMTNRVVHGNQVTVEWIATGMYTGGFPDLPASGRSFSISGVTVVIRRKGKIVRESLYYDMEEVRHQLSAS